MISFRINWFDLPAVQGNLKSLLQHRSSKVSVLQHLAFFMVQLSHNLYGSSIFNFFKDLRTVSTVVTPIYIPNNSVQVFLFLHKLANKVICCLFYRSHSDGCAVISHCGFELHFPDDLVMLSKYSLLSSR